MGVSTKSNLATTSKLQLQNRKPLSVREEKPSATFTSQLSTIGAPGGRQATGVSGQSSLTSSTSLSTKSKLALTGGLLSASSSQRLPLTSAGSHSESLLKKSQTATNSTRANISSPNRALLSTTKVKTTSLLLTGTGTSSSIRLSSLVNKETSPSSSLMTSTATSCVNKPLAPKATTTTAAATHSSSSSSSHVTTVKSHVTTVKKKSLHATASSLSNTTKSQVVPQKSRLLSRQQSKRKEEKVPTSTIEQLDTVTAKPITSCVKDAPHYNFSSDQKSQVKKKLFISPEKDASLQTPPAPAVDIVGMKITLINAVATSLLCSPNFKNSKDMTRQTLLTLGEKLSRHDPEFLLKLALYTRVHLNIRTTTNFLLALAANLPQCRPFLKKYYSSAIRLPSDWIEVAEIYQAFHDTTLNFGALPTALRKVMCGKFGAFDAYQLAKYNKDTSKKRKKLKMEEEKKEKTEKKEEKKKQQYKADYPALNVPDSESDSGDDDNDSSIVLSESEDKKEVERLSFTLKQLIRKIHISEPVEYVMCLVGKKYPEDPEAFRKSRLPGVWDSEQAGKRMKLPTPETWETQVSTKGNKASTWEELIDHNKLPFMAMLRNLRNLILAGVSSKHHQWAMRKLNDERAVVNSKQFPFRFFSAYEVLEKLEKMSNGDETTPQRKDRKKGKKEKKKKEMPEIDKSLLHKYKSALDNALKIATTYNVKPIGGSTLILCNAGHSMDKPCTAARGLGKPLKIAEVGILLGLMCKYSCEKSTMLVYGGNEDFMEVELQDGTILKNMEVAKSAVSGKQLARRDGVIPMSIFNDMLVDQKSVDNIVIFTDNNDYQIREMRDFLKKYRHLVNPELLFVSVDLSTARSGLSDAIKPEHPNDIYLAGYSDQILRFIAERGDSGQLTYVDNIDKAFNLTGVHLPSLDDSTDTSMDHLLSLSSEKALLSATAHGQKWRTVRVFISSTFRDMHGERDLLTRFVFPELRARAHSRQIHIYEVDLRWGVTEQDARSHKTLEVCLDEISRSQYFIGLLGERYGWVQDEYAIPDSPKYDWLKEFPTRRSITEVEMYHAALCDEGKAVNKAFFFFRDPSFMDHMPSEFKEDFENESEEAQEKIDALKSDIRYSGLEVYDNYPCRWLGVVQDKPMVGGLESFGQRVLYNLWNAIQRDYPEDDELQDPIAEAAAQHSAFEEDRADKFIGRCALIGKTIAAIEDPNNQLVLVTGKPGSGKSAFMAAVAQEYAAFHTDIPLNLVLPHFIGAAPGSSNIAQLLTRLCHEMKRRFGVVSREIPEDYTDLAREWQDFLEDSAANVRNINSKLVILIDGIDLLEDKHNGRSLDWIPEQIPKRVVLLVSGVEGGLGVNILRKRAQPPVEITIGPLDMFDKAEMVRKKLSRHRKKLDESPFNNQLKILLTKKEAANPLYLHLACEELRVLGVFEGITAYLKKMPTTIAQLLQEILQRLEIEHTRTILSTALMFLTLVRNGLLEHELSGLLVLALRDVTPESEGVALTPMAMSKLLRSLQTFLQPTGQETAGLLTLAHKDIEKAVQLRYVPQGAASGKEHHRMHMLLAEFFRAEADPQCDGTFKGNSARAFMELPYHLTKAGAWGELETVVCSINFVIAKCKLGLAQELLEDYMPVSSPETSGSARSKTQEAVKFIQQPTVMEFKSFVSRNLHVLLKNPNLALQQAINEPASSAVASKTENIKSESSDPMLTWLNKPEEINPCQMNITSQTGAIFCVDVSADSSLFAAGFRNGAVKVYEVASGKEVHTFIGHAGAINDICFVGTQSVCSASNDTTLSVWSIKQGIRLATLKGHSRGIHGCASDKAGKNVVSVSWDTSIKVWEGRSGKLLSTLKTQGQHNTPINCVTFHPEGQLVAVGSWDASVKIWDTFNQKRLKVLKGHRSSVQACAYAPSGRHIVSAALDGEVKVWSTKSGTAVGTITGHHFPVNAITFTPNGQYLTTASSDKVVKVWSGTLGQQVCSIGSTDLGFVHKLVLDHQSQSVTVGYHDGHVRQFNVQTKAEIFAVRPHSAAIVGLAHHKNFHMSASADGSIKVWDVSLLPRSVELKGHSSPLTCAEWDKNGFASASEDFLIQIWPHKIHTYSNRYQNPQRWATKGKSKAAAKDSISLEVKPLAVLQGQHTGKITGLSFSCDGTKMIAVSQDRSISVWNTLSNTLLQKLEACHKDWITTCSFSDMSPDVFVTGSSDFTLKMWDLRTAAEKSTFRGHTSAVNSVVFSQGCVVSVGVDGSVKVWTHKGVEITTMFCHKQRVNACLLYVPSTAAEKELISSWADVEDKSDDPKIKVQLQEIVVLTGSDDGTVGVWKPFLPNEITSLIGHTDRVVSVAATLNNHFLSSSLDGSIRMWSPSLPTNAGSLVLTHTSSGGSGGHTGPVTALSVIRREDSSFVVSGGRDGCVMVWEIAGKDRRLTKLYQVKHSEKAVSSVCFTGLESGAKKSGTFVVGDDGGQLTEYQFSNLEFPKTTNSLNFVPSLGTHPISKLTATPDLKIVLAGSWSREITAFNKKMKAKLTMDRHYDWVMDVVATEKEVYSVGLDCLLCSWKLEQKGPNLTLPSSSKYKLHLKSGSDDKDMEVWPLAMCKVQGTDFLAVSDSKGQVTLWSTAILRVEMTRKLHSKQVNAIASGSDECFMTGSDDNTVKMWKVEVAKRKVSVVQVGQFYSQACITNIVVVRKEDKNSKNCRPLFAIGNSLGHINLLEWQP